MKSNLCNRCGSCVGLSGGAIVFEDKIGKYSPVQKKPIDDQMGDVLLHACSGRGFNFPYYSSNIFGSTPGYHKYIGSFQKIYIGYCTDEAIRRNAASGGIISAVLIWLLENKRIDGAVVLGMSRKEPWMNEPFIAKTKEEILAASQSKYTISSVNEILPKIMNFQGNLAYVGLPGQVQSIRKLQEINHVSVKKIKYIFGPFYGNTLHFSSVASFLRSYRVTDYRAVTRLYFRYGEWPGNMRAELRDGRVVQLPKFHANYLIPFHILKNSLLCTDLTNEFTDISSGDAWAPVYEERGKGFSMIITRSVQGQKIISNMAQEGLISLQEISMDTAIEMHSHGYDLKKRGTFIRMKFRRWLGKENPDYGYTISHFTLSRYLMEFLTGALFLILGTAPARYMVEKIPPDYIGRLFEKIRTIWKKSTYNIKRTNLN